MNKLDLCQIFSVFVSSEEKTCHGWKRFNITRLLDEQSLVLLV